MSTAAPAGPLESAPGGFVPEEERSAVLASVLDGVELGAWGPAGRRVAGRAGHVDGADGRVVDRAVAGCGAGAVSGTMEQATGFRLLLDVICSIFMSCLGIAARVPRSTRRMSTRPSACWRPGYRRLRPPACWPGGWAARSGRPAATSARPRRRPGPGPGRGRCVHRPASRPAGRRGPGARPGVRPHGLFGRRAGSGGVPRPYSRERSAQVRELAVETQMLFSRHAAAEMSVAYGILVPQRRARTAAPAAGGGDDDGSGDLREGLQRPAGEGRDDRLPARRPARPRRREPLHVPEEWVFADEGHSGATLVRPGLEALRDLAAQGCLDVVLVNSPDRLARKFAYQALLIEKLARCGTRVEFVKGPGATAPRTSCSSSSRACSPSTRRPSSPSATGAARPGARRPAASTCSAAPRSATATSAGPPSAGPATRSSPTRPCWSPRCSAATPTAAPRSRTCAAG